MTTLATAVEVRVNRWGRYIWAMVEARIPETGSALKLRRAGVWVVSAFWLVQFIELSVVGLIQGAAFAVHQLPERLILVAAGMLLSVLLLEFAARLEERPFRIRLVGIGAAALLMCTALVVFAYVVARLPIWGPRHFDVAGFVYVGFAWSWFFLSVAAAILALSYSAEVRSRGEKLARLEVVARDARLAALRYQINPHFLFNTLNSIAGLISGNEAAEAMVVNLADFFRATLELDPIDTIPLEREFEFLRLYLAIEQVRFPNRLVAEIDLPQSLTSFMVPALLTQPLVENSVQHAVARSTGLVTLRVTASVDDNWLTLRVADDGGTPVGPPRVGTGTGLGNVANRLATTYGTEQSLSAMPQPGGGFCTEVLIRQPRPL